MNNNPLQDDEESNETEQKHETTINTQGGTYVGGDVNTGGGDYVGRDKTIIISSPERERSLQRLRFSIIFQTIVYAVLLCASVSGVYGYLCGIVGLLGLSTVFGSITLASFMDEKSKNDKEITRLCKISGIVIGLPWIMILCCSPFVAFGLQATKSPLVGYPILTAIYVFIRTNILHWDLIQPLFDQ